MNFVLRLPLSPPSPKLDTLEQAAPFPAAAKTACDLADRISEAADATP
jgi:hypothetical protein